MLPCASDATLARLTYGMSGLLVLCALIFWPVQNAGLLPGGAIAPQKLLWLGVALWYFYALPLLIWLDPARHAGLRGVMGLFLAAMLLRGVVELYLIYVALGWSPWMGLAFNGTALAGLGCGLWRYRRQMGAGTGWLAVAVLALAMGFESAFATYFHILVAPDGATTGDQAVYFVSSESGHGTILLASLAASLLLIALAPLLLRRRRAAHA